jgi:hypothetical protein
MGDRNEGQEFQRRFIIDQISTTGVRCELVDVVHGTFEPGGEDCSLIVIQLSIFPIEVHRRLRSMTVTFQFVDMVHPGNAHDDPEVLDLAPQGHFILSPTTRQTMMRRESAAGVDISVGTASYRSQRSHESRSGLTLLGMALVLGRTYGRPNAVSWTVRENPDVRDGISCLLRAPILVRRLGNNLPFQAQVTLKTEGTGWSALLSKFAKVFESRKEIDPVYFDPRMAPTNRKFDVMNLGSEHLNTIAAIQNVDTPLLEQEGSPTADFKLGAATRFTGLKFPDLELGELKGGKDPEFAGGGRLFGSMTKDQIFLACALGRNPDINYVFKRFETLSLFNLYKHQQKLVELHGKISDDADKGLEVEDTVVDELADLLRKYRRFFRLSDSLSANISLDKALLAFVNVSQLEIPSEQASLSTASFFRKNLDI